MGVSENSGSTAFQRSGGTNQSVSNALDGSFQNLLNSTLSQRTQQHNQQPFDYLLGQMVAPTDYENNTQSLWENRLSRSLALSRSGPQAVMAPYSRGFGQAQAEVGEEAARGRGDEVRKQQLIDRQLGVGAAESFNRGDQSGQSTDTNTLISLANILYPRNQNVQENYTGQGSQSSSAMSFGCCFIFLEAYNGVLPTWVRECRDEFAPESSARRVGYVAMSKWLVPAMRLYPWVRKAVNSTMVQPLTNWGGHYKNVPGYSFGRKYAPIKTMWFAAWSLIGKLIGA